MVDNGPTAELDDGSIRDPHVCIDESHQMLAGFVSIYLVQLYENLTRVPTDNSTHYLIITSFIRIFRTLDINLRE